MEIMSRDGIHTDICHLDRAVHTTEVGECPCAVCIELWNGTWRYIYLKYRIIMFRIYHNDIHFTWARTMVCHIKERTQVKDIWDKDAEDNV
jgi:hypothetical protein